jgi:hypothetical protein
MHFLHLDITIICGVEIKYTPNYVSMIGSVFCAATDMTIGSTGMFFLNRLGMIFMSLICLTPMSHIFGRVPLSAHLIVVDVFCSITNW